MAKSKKYEDNLRRIQNVLDDKHEVKIQSGFIPENIHEGRSIGDKWTDSDGMEWEQKDGYRSKITKIEKGIADNCSDCDKYITSDRDNKFFRSFKRCFYCQINFESKLELYPIKYWAWKRLRAFKVWESIDKEALQYFEEKEKLDSNKIYDKTVANAIANSNVTMTINKNKS